MDFIGLFLGDHRTNNIFFYFFKIIEFEVYEEASVFKVKIFRGFFYFNDILC